MDYDIVYIDDPRNATTDHRTQGGSRPATGSRTVVVPPSARPTVITAGGAHPTSSYYRPAAAPMIYPQQPLAARFGMTTGELIDTGIQILTAIQPLPAAPTAQGDVGVDTENLVTYQSALWSHAKRDEQLRTLGNLLARILK